MKSKLLAANAGERTYVLVLDAGEDAFQTITRFANEERVSAASLTALGAFSQATVG
jgi:predicted DNA-binding protein with PD1-like motif